MTHSDSCSHNYKPETQKPTDEYILKVFPNPKSENTMTNHTQKSYLSKPHPNHKSNQYTTVAVAVASALAGSEREKFGG